MEYENSNYYIDFSFYNKKAMDSSCITIFKKMKDNSERFTAISLFSSGGIGDIAARAANIDILVSNELLPDRCSIFSANFPETKMIVGDIYKNVENIIKETKSRLNGNELDFAFATPPCQGMSQNGMGTLLKGIREGKKPKLDVRNKLIVPALDIICALKPRIVVFENVPNMQNTVISTGEKYINIIDYIKIRLGVDYAGKAEVVEFADYGVPQMRQRLITIFSRTKSMKDLLYKKGSLLPERTHAQNPMPLLGIKKWVTVRDAIYKLPKLDAKSKETATSNIEWHRVPILSPEKYFWVEHTPIGKGAFDNQCIICGFQGNPSHGAKKDKDGINRPNKNTPLYCIKCGALLPRPYVIENGQKRIMSGFTSAYKRMDWDKPASTLTKNFSYACSDHKLHPEQNRVLSLYEAFILHTINDFDYHWKNLDGSNPSDKTIREIIGESIPPRGLSKIYTYLTNYL